MVTEEQAFAALTLAVSRIGGPYVYGGRGPEAFDCSGIITWAYRQVIPDLKLDVGAGKAANDATIEALFHWNYRQVSLDKLVPGDLVFLSDGTAAVTHAGMVTAVSADTIRFLNASSYYGVVIEDEWPLVGEKRGQIIVGYGRLTISF